MHYGKVKVTQSCVSLHDPRDYTVHGVLQARMLECVCVRARVHAWLLSLVRLFVTPWTEAHQASLSMGFSGQEHWSGLPYPPPGDLPDPGIKPTSPMTLALQVDSLLTEPSGKPRRIYSWVSM